MATWMQSQTTAVSNPGRDLFLRTLLGEPSDAEIEERYVVLARAILASESSRQNAA